MGYRSNFAVVLVLAAIVASACGEDSSSSSGDGAQGSTAAPGVAAPAPAATQPATDTQPAGTQPTTGTQPAMDTSGAMDTSTPTPGGTAGAPAPAPTVDTCGADPATTGDGICPGGLVCGDPTGTQNYSCMCPASPTMLPPCTVGGTECEAFPGTVCSNLFGMQGCHTPCTPPGVMAPACPDPLECVALGPGIPAFCAMAGQLAPPPCATQEDCAAYEGTFCMDPLGLGTLGCVKSCTP
ncbi:MAG: hypothetical protein PVI30_09660 [Myxococcales bacterium]|jgi:hypothetical protein